MDVILQTHFRVLMGKGNRVLLEETTSTGVTELNFKFEHHRLFKQVMRLPCLCLCAIVCILKPLLWACVRVQFIMLNMLHA
jgi:hypothetical protein